MDSTTSTEDIYMDEKISQENLLLGIIKEICSENKLSSTLKGKVTRIISDCDLSHHTSLHKLYTADDSTSTLLGFMHQTASELTFDEQTELNETIINKIQIKIPTYLTELDDLKQHNSSKNTTKDKIKELQQSIHDKLNTLEEEEDAKVELMMEWLNHRIRDVTKFSDDSSELLTLKTRILSLKSKMFHLQTLQNIFTETNQSIKAYTEVHKDLKESIQEMEQRIKNFKDVIESDLYE